jgi:hypothetical protein
MTTAPAMTTASAAMRGHRAGRNRRHTKRNRCHERNSELTQHDTFLPITPRMNRLFTFEAWLCSG